MTEIRLYNTKTRKKEVFAPLDWRNDDIPDAEKKIQMYVCGPTVYDRAHLGNARPVIVFDILFRLLRHVYGPDHVTYARNFTDVDDKINAAAQNRKQAGVAGTLEELIQERTDETIQWFLEDMAALGALEPDHAPRATEYIAEMIAMNEDLIASENAYLAEGHVLFDVTSYENYGSLSGRSIDDMIAGARVEVAPYKRNPMDFVLWKPSTDEQPGWDSPWGRGRPGWHIECSAMTKALFGETFDIHAGGLDLAFPHHENEKAQSCCQAGEESFAQVWMHNEMLQVEGKKMSKSLGNFFSVRELLDQGYPGEVIRFVMLSTHYRKPMDWTDKKAKEAKATLKKWFNHIKYGLNFGDPSAELFKLSGIYAPDPEVVNTLGSDLNTAGAIARMHKLCEQSDRASAQALLGSMAFLGLLNKHTQVDLLSSSIPLFRSPDGNLDSSKLILEIAEQRNQARSQGNYERADQIRESLKEAGVEIEDNVLGSKIKYLPHFDAQKLKALK